VATIILANFMLGQPLEIVVVVSGGGGEVIVEAGWTGFG
jgi:hypothetical protein